MIEFKLQLKRNSQILQALYNRLRSEFRNHPHGQRHHEACDEYHRRYDELAFPGTGFNKASQLLKERDPSITELVIQYLEVDPWYNHSGYMKKRMCRYVKKMVLNHEHKNRLADVITKQVIESNNVEIRVYAQIAGHLQLPELEDKMYDLLEDQNDIISNRARRVLVSINHFKK